MEIDLGLSDTKSVASLLQQATYANCGNILISLVLNYDTIIMVIANSYQSNNLKIRDNPQPSSKKKRDFVPLMEKVQRLNGYGQYVREMSLIYNA